MDGGALTPLIYAVRSNDLDSVKALLTAGADINQVSGYGWSPLLVATQNRYYKLGAYLLDPALRVATREARVIGLRAAHLRDAVVGARPRRLAGIGAGRGWRGAWE